MSYLQRDRIDPAQFLPELDRPVDQRIALALEFIAGALGRIEKQLATRQPQADETATSQQPQAKLGRAA